MKLNSHFFSLLYYICDIDLLSTDINGATVPMYLQGINTGCPEGEDTSERKVATGGDDR